MNNQKIFDPIPDFKSGEKIFECCTKGLYNESKEGYEFFEQLAKKLFEHFKYQYEVLSPVVLPENEDDIHIYQYIKKAAEKEIINLDGTKYIVPESGCIFNEKRHVHFTRFHAFGGINTPFPLGKSMANHHLTLEDYVLSLKYPLFKFAYNEEIIPYVFPTDHNYFLESANNCFMDDNKYDVKPNPIIYHSMHKEIYTPKYFNDKLNVSPILLSFKTNISTKFVKILSRGKNVKYNRTINFALQLLYSSILILSGFVDIFGSSRNRSEMLLNLNENWTYPNGRKIKGINIYHLNILSFLYLTFHPTATVLGYGLYRNKYGVNSKSAHRTAFYLTDDKIVIALKDYVSKVVKEKINEYSLDLKYIEDNELINDYKDYIKEIILLIKALLIIASYYGTGYKTEDKKGVNVHINKPVNYQPEKIPNLLKDINFVVEHNENSPFWRLFYDYCSGWWDENEIISIIRGKGDYWIKNTNNPRIRIINVFYGYAFEFLRARYKYIKNNDKDNQKEIENIESIFKKYDTGAGSRN